MLPSSLLSRLPVSQLVRCAILGAVAGGIGVGVVNRADQSGRVAAIIAGAVGVALGYMAFTILRDMIPGRTGRFIGSIVAGIFAGLFFGLLIPELRVIGPLAGLFFGVFINWFGLLIGGFLASILSGLFIGALASLTAPGADPLGGAISGVVINLLYGTIGVFIVWIVDKIYGVILVYVLPRLAQIDED